MDDIVITNPAHPPSPPSSVVVVVHTPRPGRSSSTAFVAIPSGVTGISPTSRNNNDARDDDAAANGDNEGRQQVHFTLVLAVLAIDASSLAAILAESQDTVRGWSTGPRVVYGVVVVVSIALLAVGIMAAARHAAGAVGWRGGSGSGSGSIMLSVSASCAKLSAISSSAILVVVVTCKLGRWGCVAGVPPAAVIASAMAAVWLWGDERAAAPAVSNCWGRLRGQRPAGDEEPLNHQDRADNKV